MADYKEWTIISVTITVLIFFFALIIYNPGNAGIPGQSPGFLSIGSSDGFTSSEINKDFKALSIAPDCTPESGYNKCFQYEKTNSYSGANARAYVKIQASDAFIGKQKGGYYVGPVEIPLRFTGDEFYVYENVGSWDNLWNNIARCDENGCNGAKQSLSGTDVYRLASPGQEYVGCPAFVAFDFDCEGDCFNDDAEDPWSWATISGGWGWVSSSNTCLNIKSVACYDDTDCGSSQQYCDKSGSWQTWSCKQKECTVNADCAKFNTNSTAYCSEGNSYTDVSTATCSQSYQCVKETVPQLEDSCMLGCSETSGTCTEKSTGFIIGAILGVLVLAIVGVLIFLKFRKKRR